MTREEEIRLYLKERNIPISSLEANSIIEGAQWADKHPIYVQGQTDEMQATEVEFTDWWFANHKEQPTYADTLEWMKERMIDKACEWLEQHQESYDMYDAWNGDYVNFKSLIIDFRKAMEE